MENINQSPEYYEERLQDAERMSESLIYLNQLNNKPLNEVLDYILETGISLTKSQIGYIYFYNEDTRVLTNYSWSKDVMPSCKVSNPQTIYELEKTGLWGEAVRQRKPIITNDYASSNPKKRGIPEGHMALTRHMDVPLFVNERIVALIGVANKKVEYSIYDIKHLTLLMSEGWKRAEGFEAAKKFRESEERFRSTFEQAAVGICHIALDSTVVRVNQKLCDILGYNYNELGNIIFTDIICSEDLQKFLEMNSKLLSDSIKSISIETRCIKKDRTKIYGNLTTSLMRELTGQPLYFITVIQEITERKQAEETLRQSEEKFSKAFHGGPIMMALATVEEGKFIDANEALCSGTGYTREEIIGRTTKELDFFVDMGKRQESGKRLMEQGRTEDEEFDFRTKSGEIRHGLSWSQLISLDGQPCHITGLIDVTEQKHVQKEIARLERLNLVGEMAAGIGHEVRNPMTTVRGFLQLLSTKEECSKYDDYYNLMINELDRANSIITEFLAMAKDRVVEQKVQSLKQIVENIFPLIQAEGLVSDKNIHMELEEVEEIPLDKKEIRQLILNLVQNGSQAMSPGGTMKIRTFMSKGKVVLAVQDDGGGITQEVLAKIGTPFFTTKENGTGLGLAVCYSIVARHNAKIDIETGATGTTFFVRFKK